ncbi:hypothetical protein [Novosphingobium sp. AAP83]|uniref:hypothetical protein n=1 Tax=Novosphingobium sp. AAP83 TaxID=1523425 RepID=UPI0018D086D1|nr:hypothetical protein [Novosphingobium sp. AAP83]
MGSLPSPDYPIVESDRRLDRLTAHSIKNTTVFDQEAVSVVFNIVHRTSRLRRRRLALYIDINIYAMPAIAEIVFGCGDTKVANRILGDPIA